MTTAVRPVAAALLAAFLVTLAASPARADNPECSSCTARHKALQALQAARTDRAGAGPAGIGDMRAGALLPPPAGTGCAGAAEDGTCPAETGTSGDAAGRAAASPDGG